MGGVALNKRAGSSARAPAQSRFRPERSLSETSMSRVQLSPRLRNPDSSHSVGYAGAAITGWARPARKVMDCRRFLAGQKHQPETILAVTHIARDKSSGNYGTHFGWLRRRNSRVLASLNRTLLRNLSWSTRQQNSANSGIHALSLDSPPVGELLRSNKLTVSSNRLNSWEQRWMSFRS